MTSLGADLAEALARNEIDAKWVAGIRKGWKAKSKAARDYKGRIGQASKIDFDALYASADGASAALDGLIGYVRDLRADLLVNKGFAPLPGGAPSRTKDREKVIGELNAAEDAIKEAKSGVHFWKSVLTPGSHEHQLDGGFRYREAGKSLRDFQLHLNGIELRVVEAAISADKAISGKLLMYLGKLAEKAGGKLEMPAGEPDEVSLGKARIVFADALPAGSRPRETAWLATGVPVDGSMSVKTASRPPQLRHLYINAFKEAEALLRRRGLGYLWYGKIFVMCKDCGGKNQHGAEWGVGARYHRKGDYVTVYTEPGRGLARLMAHELGHRYYFKFMSADDRGRFGEFFGQVKPVTTYGGVATEEDFAEVFAWYIDGQELDRDQLQRFRAFLGRKRQTEGLLSSALCDAGHAPGRL